jgi:hypothetical protein
MIPHAGVDTTALDSTDKPSCSPSGAGACGTRKSSAAARRQRSPIRGHVRLGKRADDHELAAARALGLTPASIAVRPVNSGRLTAFSYRFDRTPAAPDTETNHSATGLAFRVGGRTLAPDSVIISDATFGDLPDVKTRPLILVGLRHFRAYILLLSYSTSSVCIKEP